MATTMVDKSLQKMVGDDAKAQNVFWFKMTSSQNFL